MKTQLSQAQIDSYRANGFLIVEGFLDAPELERWREVAADAVRHRLSEPQTQAGGNRLHDYNAQVFTQWRRLIDTHAGMRELLLDARLGQMAGTLAGVAGIRVYQDQALFKPPYGNPTPYHLDTPYWSVSARESLSVWVPLGDANLEDGCLCYLPGTFRDARDERVPLSGGLGDLFNSYPAWRQIAPVPAPCPAGSAVFHNGYTAHGASANMTNRPRRVLTCSFIPDGAAYNGRPDAMPADVANRLQIGRPLDDDARYPLIWTASQ